MKHHNKLTKSEIVDLYVKDDLSAEKKISEVAQTLPARTKKTAVAGYDQNVTTAINKALSNLKGVDIIDNSAEDSVIEHLLSENEPSSADDYTSVIAEAWSKVSSRQEIEVVNLYCRDETDGVVMQCDVPVWSQAITPVASSLQTILGTRRRIAYWANIDEPEVAMEERFASHCRSTKINASGINKIGLGNSYVYLINLGTAEEVDEKALAAKLSKVMGKDIFFAYRNNDLVTIEVPGLFSENIREVKHHGYGVIAGVSCMEWAQTLYPPTLSHIEPLPLPKRSASKKSV